MKSIYDVIIRPIITEKASGLVENLQYTFEVAVEVLGISKGKQKKIKPLISRAN